MEEQLYKKIEDMEIKIDTMYRSMESARKMIKWSLIASVLLFVLPLIVLAFVLPSMLSTITGDYSALLGQ